MRTQRETFWATGPPEDGGVRRAVSRQVGKWTALLALPLAAVCGGMGAFVSTSGADEPIAFRVRQLMLDANEGAATGDIDGDSKSEIAVAGNSGASLLLAERSPNP